MAALDDVLTALANLVSDALTTAALPVANQVITGWPDANQLKRILDSGGFQVSIYPLPMSKNSTYAINQPWRTVVPENNVTITTQRSDKSFILSGYSSAGLTVRLVSAPNGPVVTYKTTDGDTLETVVTALVDGLEDVGISAIAIGSIIEIDSDLIFNMRISGPATQTREARRVARQIQISVWAPTPALRSEAVSAIESIVGSEYNSQPAIEENSSMWIRYVSDRQIDKSPADNTAYINHLILTVDYPIYEQRIAYQITDIRVSVNANGVAQDDLHV